MCKCLEMLNEKLKEDNTFVVSTINLFHPERSGQIYLETAKLNTKKRNRPTRIIAKFCPVCGIEYFPEQKDVK